jgi:tripartite-type tricarboxylate transporter receptor subunit TctC
MSSRHAFLKFLFPALVLTLGCQTGDEARPPSVAENDACRGVTGETVRWIIAGSSGGGLDVLSRLLAPFYEEALGAQIAMENRVGGGGLLGARIVRDAAPDGRTLGIINGTALLVASLSEDQGNLHPQDDFTVVGRIAIEAPIWVGAPSSRLRSIEDVRASARTDPVLFGITDVSGPSFAFTSFPAELLGLDLTYLTGYLGAPEAALGLLRGEFDLTASTFETFQDRIEAGELTPILQISDRPLADHPALAAVPVLGGAEGLVAQVARERGEDPEAAVASASVLDRLFRVGRLIVGPPGLAPDQAACLSARLGDVVHDPAFLAAAERAGRTITYASPSALAEEVRVSETDLASMASVVLRYIERARGTAPTP